MLKSLLIAVTLLASSIGWARGDVVGNGIGLAERRFRYVFENLEGFIGLCLSANMCRLSPQETDLALKIMKAMPIERGHKRPIQFKSEKKNPGFFLIDGQIKAAKTGLQIGSPIYINSDMTVRTTFYGQKEAMDEPEVLAILIHELGHHHGIKDEAQLDNFASKFQTALLASLQRVELGFRTANIQVSVLNTAGLGNLPQVWVSDGAQMFDLSKMILPYLKCPPGYRTAGGHISNTHWSWQSTPDPTYPGIWYVWIEGYAMPYCTLNGIYQDVAKGNLFRIGMQTFPQAGAYFLVPGSFFYN